MDYEVIKPFNTETRRFAPGPGVGGVVNEQDDLSPHTIGSLKAKDFIKEKVVPAAEIAPTPSFAPSRQPIRPQRQADDEK